MATKKPTKKKKPTAPKLKKPLVPAYDPMAPLTPDQIKAKAGAAAQSQIAPQQNLLNQERARQTSANAARQKQIQGFGAHTQAQLDKAFADTNAALNNLIATSGATDQASQNALQTALGRGSQPTPGDSIGSNEAEIMAAAAAQRASMGAGLTGQSMAQLGAQGERRSLATTGMGTQNETERRRFNAILQELMGKETDLAGQLGALTTAESTKLEDREIAKATSNRDYRLAVKKYGEDRAGRLFQQWLAEQELGDKRKAQSFSEYLAKQELGLKDRGLDLSEAQFQHTKEIDWANIGINQAAAEADIAKDKKDKKDKRDAAKSGAYQKGYEVLSAIMSPGAGEGLPNASGRYPGQGTVDAANPKDDPLVQGDETLPNSRYQRRFDDVFGQMVAAGIPRNVALDILRKSNYGDWAKKARVLYAQTVKDMGPHRPPGSKKPAKKKQDKGR